MATVEQRRTAPAERVRDVDELELALLDAMHVNPRASFEQLGTVLEVSAVTAARRWQRLTRDRRAWVSSVPGPRSAMAAAIYEVECSPGRTDGVGRVLAALPQVASVYLTAGTFDIAALVVAPGMSALSELLLDRLSVIPGISRVRSSIVTNWYSDVRWRLGAISTSQELSVRGEDAARDRASEPRTLRFDQEDRELYLALQHDGRARYVDLAETLGTSEQLVKRRLGRLTGTGMLAFRTDFTRTDGGWPTQLVLWLLVPDDRLAEVATEIAQWRETRICASALGPANLLVKLQLHRLDDVEPLFARIRDTLPAATVADRRLVLRPVKSWGRLLDAEGRCEQVVPVDLWASPGDTLSCI
jgi:DNA-binding Lrp family transcriptional regulator